MGSYKGISFSLIACEGGLWEYSYTIGTEPRNGAVAGAVQLAAERNVWALIEVDLALAKRGGAKHDDRFPGPSI
jgi:hypothetical protein